METKDPALSKTQITETDSHVTPDGSKTAKNHQELEEIVTLKFIGYRHKKALPLFEYNPNNGSAFLFMLITFWRSEIFVYK